MANVFKPKRSYTASAQPTLAAGELGIQAADKKVFIGNSAGTGNILVASLNGADITGTVASATTATSATSATTATNLAGGGAGQLPYQSSTGTTAMLANGTSGQLLQSNGGTSAPSWVASPVIPTGSLFPYAGSSAPTGYLLCDSSAVSRSTYAALFAVIGTTYGSGNGSTTFNLPDLRGRFPMGAGTGTGLNSSGTGVPSGPAQTARTSGQWGGEETHLLTTAEMPAHNHSSTNSLLAYVATGGGANLNSGSTYNIYNASSLLNNTGGGGRHSVIPPFVVVNYIIKT